MAENEEAKTPFRFLASEEFNQLTPTERTLYMTQAIEELRRRAAARRSGTVSADPDLDSRTK